MWVHIISKEKNIDLRINLGLVRSISLDKMMGSISFVFGDVFKDGRNVFSQRTFTQDELGKEQFDRLKAEIEKYTAAS